jgi:hypothetical protein
MDIEKLFRLKEYIDSVSSTNVKKVKWDSVSKVLVIQFKDGSIYTYSNVPEAIYTNVLDGQAGTKTEGPWGPIGTYPSVGAAVHQWLINGGYKYRKGGNIN